MEYALLYTFSTIPQTLASALGVLAAFVLFRLQSIHQTLWDDARELVNPFGANQWIAGDVNLTFADLMGTQKYDSLLAELKRRYATGQPPPPGSAQELSYKRFTANLLSRYQIRNALRVAFIATAVVIVGSVFELALAQVIIRIPHCVGYLLLALGLAALALCLRLYWLVVQAALWTEDKALGPLNPHTGRQN
jgi:hypothetical protein